MNPERMIALLDGVINGLVAIQAELGEMMSPPCEHKNSKPSPESTMTDITYICEDCGQVLSVEEWAEINGGGEDDS